MKEPREIREQLRMLIARLRRADMPPEAPALARLAAGYLLAADVEAARRYVARAEGISQTFNTPVQRSRPG